MLLPHSPAMARLGAFVRSHLDSHHVSRVLYGAIIGLALIFGLEHHPPTAHETTVALLATAFNVAEWSGIALTAFYGWSAGRLAGQSRLASAVQACAVALIGVALIG